MYLQGVLPAQDRAKDFTAQNESAQSLKTICVVCVKMDFLLNPLIAKFEKKLETISNDLDFLCNRTAEIEEKLAKATTVLQSLVRDLKSSHRPQSPRKRSSAARDGSSSPSRSTENNETPQGSPAKLVSV